MQSYAGTHGTPVRPASVARARQLVPNGRALVGGLLVALSAAGLFAAHQAATTRVVPSYAVASRDLPAGARIARGDIDLVPIDLPGPQRARAFDDAEVLVGALAVAPIAAGDVVQASAVAAGPAFPGRVELSLPVDPARALAGRLDAGEWVDVIATYGTGDAAVAATVAQGAVVVAADAGEGSIGSADSLTVTLAVTGAEVEELTRAAAAGELTLVRRMGGVNP